MRTDFLGGDPERVDQPRHLAFANRLIGLPASMHSAIASSSKRSRKRLTQCSSTAWRWNGAICAHRLGLRVDRGRDAGVDRLAHRPCATRVATSPVYLSVTSRSVFGCDRLVGEIVRVGGFQHGSSP